MPNLTLTIDADVLKRARMTALRRDTSVNALVREFLENIADEDETDQGVRDLLEIARRSNAGSGPGGRTWTRDELYEERLSGNGRSRRSEA